MSRLKCWYYGWRATLWYMIHDRESYRQMKQPFTVGDFGEVPDPLEAHQRWVDSLKEDQSMKDYLDWLEQTSVEDLPKGTAGFGDMDSENGGKFPRFGSDELE